METKTVAEFVENEEIRDIVTASGADYGQGFGQGRPAELFLGAQGNKANTGFG